MGGQAAPQIVLYKNGGSGSGDGDNRSTNSGLFFVCLHVQQIKHGPPQRSSSHRNTNRQFATCVRAAAVASSLHQKDNRQNRVPAPRFTPQQMMRRQATTPWGQINQGNVFLILVLGRYTTSNIQGTMARVLSPIPCSF